MNNKSDNQVNNKIKSQVRSIERRRFLALSGKYGFTAAVVAGSLGMLSVSEEAAALTAKEEKFMHCAPFRLGLHGSAR